jgi:hypothetical protein
MGNSKIIGGEKMMEACEDSRILGITCIFLDPKPLTPESVPYSFNSAVQCAHFTALMGIVERQKGHPFVVGAAGGTSCSLFSLLTFLMRRNMAKATIKKLIMVFRKTP